MRPCYQQPTRYSKIMNSPSRARPLGGTASSSPDCRRFEIVSNLSEFKPSNPRNLRILRPVPKTKIRKTAPKASDIRVSTSSKNLCLQHLSNQFPVWEPRCPDLMSNIAAKSDLKTNARKSPNNSNPHVPFLLLLWSHRVSPRCQKGPNMPKWRRQASYTTAWVTAVS